MSERFSADWYEAMAKATKKREHALAMVFKWNEAAIAAEDEISNLSNPLATATATEQE